MLASMTSSDIADQILARRRDVIADLFKGPAGQELVRLDSAFKALTGGEPPSVVDVLNEAHQGGKIVQVENESLAIADEAEVVPVPVKTAARELMSNTDLSWTYDKMLAQWESDGVVFDVKNLRDALRTAILQLMEEGVVERVQRGVYRRARPTAPEPSEDLPGPNQGGGGW